MECPVDHSGSISPNPVEGKEPPMVKGLPLLGNMAELVKSPLYFLEDKHNEYGDVFQFKAAHKQFTVLAGVEANRFMTGEGRDYFTSRESWGRFLKGARSPHLFIGIDGEEHAYQRKIFKPTFSKAAFKNRIHQFTDPLDKTFNALADGEEIFVGPFVRNLVCKQIGMALQGVEVTSEQTEEIMTTQNTFLNVYMLGKWPKLVFLNPRILKSIFNTLKFIKQVRADNLARTPEQRAQCPTYVDKLEDQVLQRTAATAQDQHITFITCHGQCQRLAQLRRSLGSLNGSGVDHHGYGRASALQYLQNIANSGAAG